MRTPDPTVLLTGASGLVGRAVAGALTAAGCAVTGCGRRVAQDGGVRVDLAASGLDLVRECSKRPDLVVHLAAVVPGQSVPDDDEAAAMTSAMDDAVSLACAQWQCPAIYVSTCNLYDPKCRSFKRVSDPVSTRTPYLVAKYAGEQKFLARCDATIMRIPSPVAPDMPAYLVLPRMVTIALTSGQIDVWGSGSREQDFLWAGDIGHAVAAATRVPARGVFNIASGRPVTMRALAETVLSVVGAGEMTVGTRADPREGETARYDVSASRQTFGWEPRTEMQTMVRSLAASRRAEINDGAAGCA